MLTSIHQDALPKDPEAVRDRLRALDEEWEGVREGHRGVGRGKMLPRRWEVVRGVLSIVLAVGVAMLAWWWLIARRPQEHGVLEYVLIGSLFVVAIGVFGWQTWTATHRYVRYRVDESEYRRMRLMLESRLGTGEQHES